MIVNEILYSYLRIVNDPNILNIIIMEITNNMAYDIGILSSTHFQ